MQRKPYNKLTNNDKENILNSYYNFKDMSILDLAISLNVSERAYRRVLKEANINTLLKNRYIIINERYFENINSEKKAYFLGFIYADGFIGDHNDIVIGLANTEENINLLKIFKDQVGYTGEIKFSTYNNYKSSTIKFSSKNMWNDLFNLGVFPRKSLLMKKMPNIHKELYRHFIRGYFDGDGSILTYYDTYDKRRRFLMEILGTPDFLNDMQLKMAEQCNISITRLHNTHSKGITRISHKGVSNLIKIREYFYKDANIYLNYKKERFYNISPL